MPADKAKRRKLRITELVVRGKTAPSVAKKHGISAERVSQICKEVVGDLSQEYDVVPLAAANGIKDARDYKDQIITAIKHKRTKT